jgi:GNAT superfamily N-acetyltransferase
MDKIAHCEAFYRDRAMPPRFKLTAASLPAELDALLSERGYEIEAPVSVQTRPLGDVAAPDEVKVTDDPTPDWVAANIRIGGHGTWNPALFPELLDRIVLPTAYAAVWDDDEIIATGMAVAEADLAGLFEVVTDPSQRGRGLATEVVAALLAWGRARGAATGYLQVMLDNDPALRLYGRLGFTEAYRYWYRRSDEPAGSVPDPAR